MTATLVDDIDATHKRCDSETRRSGAFPRWSDDVYGGAMPQRGGKPRPPTPWMRYLKEIQDRPGWSIAKVARESGGQVSRATLFRMMTGETKKVPIETVRVVATVVGDDPEAVLTLAGGSVIKPTDETELRLEGLDPRDPVVAHILGLNIAETLRDAMLDRRRQQLAQRNEQDIQEIEFWANQGNRGNQGRGAA